MCCRYLLETIEKLNNVTKVICLSSGNNSFDYQQLMKGTDSSGFT